MLFVRALDLFKCNLCILILCLNGSVFASKKTNRSSTVIAININSSAQRLATFFKIHQIKYIQTSKQEWSINITFTNNSNKYISISDVILGCGCLRAIYSKAGIKPFQKGMIKIIYTHNNNTTYFKKSMMVLLNDGKYYKIIDIQH